MSILNVDKIQPIGGGSTITVDATDIQATTATITASSFSGSFSGNATSATTAGTVTTAAQPNITSVGTLSSLNVSGNIDANGDLDVDGQTNLDNVDVVGIMTVSTTNQYHGYKLSNGTNLVGELVGLSGSNDTGALALWSGGSKYVQLSAVGNSFLSGGSLGIGTIAPNLLLHLHQENSNATFAHFTNTTTGVNANQGVSFGLDSNEDATIYHYGSKNIRFATGGTEKIRITSAGHLKLPDNAEIRIGNNTQTGDGDMKFYHNGSNSFIQHLGTGGLYIDALNNSADIAFRSQDNINFYTNAASQSAIDCVGNGGVILYNQGNARFNTDADGAVVTEKRLAINRNAGDPFLQFQTSGTTHATLYGGSSTGFRVFTGSSQTERLRIDSDGRLTLRTGGSNLASEFNSGANQFVITHNGSCGLTIDSTSSTSSSIHFADGPTSSESYRGIIEYKHSEDDMRFAVEATHVARLRKGSYSDSGGGMIIGNNDDNSGSAHSDSRTLILGATGRSETGMTLITSTSGTGKIRFSDGVQYYNQGAIGYYHNNRTVGSIPTYGESLSFVAAQKENNFVLNGNEAMRLSSNNGKMKMVDGFWSKSINTSYQTVFSIQSGYDNSSIHRGYFYEIIVFGGDWGSHSANRTYFKGFINGYDGYQGHTVIEHSGTYGSNSGGGGHYGSSQCTIQVTFTGNGNSHIQMKLSTGGVTAEGYARFVGWIRDYDGFEIR